MRGIWIERKGDQAIVPNLRDEVVSGGENGRNRRFEKGEKNLEK